MVRMMFASHNSGLIAAFATPTTTSATRDITRAAAGRPQSSIAQRVKNFSIARRMAPLLFLDHCFA